MSYTEIADSSLALWVAGLPIMTEADLPRVRELDKKYAGFAILRDSPEVREYRSWQQKASNRALKTDLLDVVRDERLLSLRSRLKAPYLVYADQLAPQDIGELKTLPLGEAILGGNILAL